MTSIATMSASSHDDNQSASSRLSTSSRSIGSSSRTSRASDASRNTAGTSRSSRTGGSSRTSTTNHSRHSRRSAHQQQSQSSKTLPSVHEVNSIVSSASSRESSSHGHSRASSSRISRAELSLPSSFGGSAYRAAAGRALVKRGEDSVTVATQHVDDDEMSEGMALALRVERETRPMMYLVGLLKEMEGEDAASGNSKNSAIASLITEFETEVTAIEQRITNPMICDEANSQDYSSSQENDHSDPKLLMQELPEGWIALEDPDSGDIYYSNEVTGETTWDRPIPPPSQESIQTEEGSSHNSSYNSDYTDKDDSQEELPPDWVALEDPDSGDVYYANEVTGETTWDRPIMPQDDPRRGQQQQRQVKQPNQREEDNNNSSSSFSNDYQNNNDEQDEEEQSEEEEGAEEDSVDESLPSDWVPLVDPASGDTYFCNEVTGEVTWDKPQFDPKEEKNRQPSRGRRRPQDRVDEEEKDEEESSQLLNSEHFQSEDGTEDDTDPTSADDEDLPEGWFSIVDPDSGDVYYSNEITGETTWDKPENNNSPRGDGQEINDHRHNHTEFNRDDGDGGVDDSVDDDLPPGWIASVDPATGDEYFYNEETGETTWDKPLSPSSPQQDDEQFESSSADFSNSEMSAEGWFPVVDPQSGDVYYANEKTGETSWDKPDALTRLENAPRVQEEKHMLTNGNSQDDDDLPDGWFAVTDPQTGEEYYANEETGETSWDRPNNDSNATPLLANHAASEDESSLASGWFAVVDPASGDTYFANEQTGETSWEKPISRGLERSNTHESNGVHGMSRLSLSNYENTVYEDDSVTSSQY